MRTSRSVRQRLTVVAACAGLVLGTPALAGPAGSGSPGAAVCGPGGDDGPPEYYKIDLVPTGRIPGTKAAEGVADVTFKPSPFGIAVAPDGAYVYDLAVSTGDLRPPPSGVYVAWVATPDLGRVKRLGVLAADGTITGTVDWNKFLVFITNEPAAEPRDTWTGPVVLRGMSRSGKMHTMAGHGPFQQEPCGKYGF